MFGKRKGSDVEVKRGKHEGLSGKVVGRSPMGKKKVKLDDGATRWGNSIIKVDKKKLKKAK